MRLQGFLSFTAAAGSVRRLDQGACHCALVALAICLPIETLDTTAEVESSLGPILTSIQFNFVHLHMYRCVRANQWTVKCLTPISRSTRYLSSSG